MKRISKFIGACLLLLSSTGCGDSFLDLSPISNANVNDFYKTTSDFDVAVNAAYASLYVIFDPEGPVSYVAEQMGDNATLYSVGGAAGDLIAFKDYTLQASNTQVYLFWQQYYSALFDINNILYRIRETTFSENYKTSVSAQMRFLRALYYYYMVQSWGDVPLITKPVSAQEAYDVLRSPSSEVYKQIVEDLKYAVDHLPVGSGVAKPGMASKGAAQMLLGSVYLSLGNKADAGTVLMSVYNSNVYSLVPQYASLWGTGAIHKNTTESIFEIQYKGGVGNPYSKYWSSFTPTDNGVLTRYGKGMNQVADDLYSEYETGDPRRDISISPGYTDAQGNFKGVKYTIKWMDTSAPIDGSQEASDNNFIVFRYADLLLLLSEATGDPQYLNKVRGRVGLPLYGEPAYPAKYSSVALAVEHERRVELAMEFHRWFDLKRTGRASAVLSAKKGKQITASMLLLPVPLIVRTQNPLISQNSGY